LPPTAAGLVDSVIQAHSRPSPLAPRPFPETAARRNSEYQSVTDYRCRCGKLPVSAVQWGASGCHRNRQILVS